MDAVVDNHSQSHHHLWEESTFFDCLRSYLSCSTLAIVYVGSLYVWKKQNLPSTHPSVMKRRFISVLTVTVLAPKFVEYLISPHIFEDKKFSLLRILGIRFDGIFPAMFLPLLLTAVLFLGPLSMEAYLGIWNIYTEPWYWLNHIKEIMWLRCYVVAPISEEMTFRACMLALLLQCTSPKVAMFMCPLFFGTAHLHHMLEQMRFGVPWRTAFLTSCFQFVYTSIFGVYAAYLFLRTGHLTSAVLVHSFCNHMGFPDIRTLLDMPPSQRRICITAFMLGVILWSFLLEPLTDPAIYNNDLPWSNAI